MHHNNNINNNNSLLSGKRLLLFLTLGGIALLLTWLILLSVAMNSIMSSTTSDNTNNNNNNDDGATESKNKKRIAEGGSETEEENNNHKKKNDDNTQKRELKEDDIFVNEPVTIETIRHLKFRISQLEHLLIDASAALKQQQSKSSSSAAAASTSNSNNAQQVALCDQIRHDLIQSLQAEKELQIELSKCKSNHFFSKLEDHHHQARDPAQEEADQHQQQQKQQQEPNFEKLLQEEREKERKHDEELEEKNRFKGNVDDNQHNRINNNNMNVIANTNHNKQQQQQQQQYPAEQSGGRIVKGPGSDPSGDEYGTIPVLVLSYNRPKLLKNLLSRIHELLLNTNKKRGVDHLPPFRVFVSQDFDGSFPDVTATIQEAQTHSFRELGIVLMLHNRDDSGATPQEESNGWKSYYAISKHYAWAIAQTFAMNPNYRRIIILEEDLELAFDFFDFMVGMSPLFDKEEGGAADGGGDGDDASSSSSSLYCVSGFNDNGKAALVEDSSAVYRSDFFPGLGWMMSRSLWEKELRAKWPKGFWDDWMRQPAQRKGRSCLRPEISRSKPICEDGEGASQGQFCSEHLKQIVLNDPLRSRLVHWGNFNLDTLLPRIYDANLQGEVRRAKTVYNVQSTFGNTQGGSLDSTEVKLTYSSNDEFVVLAHALNLMDDFKDGVPRTAYQGIVTIKWRYESQQQQLGGRHNNYNNNNNIHLQDSAVMFSNKANEEDVSKIRKVHLVADHLLYENSRKRH